MGGGSFRVFVFGKEVFSPGHVPAVSEGSRDGLPDPLRADLGREEREAEQREADEEDEVHNKEEFDGEGDTPSG